MILRVIFTVKKIKFADYVSLIAAILLIGLFLAMPGVCANGAKSGLILSARVIIPSLFPFTVPVLYFLDSGIFSNSKRPLFIVFLLSLVGGYPIGAKLIGELNKKGVITENEAKYYLPFFVNAGPAFIVIAVGKGIIGNLKIGYILLAAHTLASFLICGVFSKKVFLKNAHKADRRIIKSDFSKNIKNASGTCLNICAYVVFFSVINAYILHFSSTFPILKYMLLFTEITSAARYAANVYLISFLLGFAGISIWLQVFSVSGIKKIDYPKFITVRLLHSVASVLITLLLLKVFKVNIATLSNYKAISGKILYSNLTLTISLIIMILLFLINFTAKKHSGNLLKDVL